MPEFNAVYKPGAEIPRVTSDDVVGGQVVVVSGDNTVAPSSAATAAVVGVAAFDAKDGETVTVISSGVFTLTATGSVTAGESVAAATDGTVAAHSGSDYSEVVGVALSDSDADDKVLVKLLRG